MKPAGTAGAGPGRVVDAGSRAYDWLKKALGVYGTAVTLVQLLPAALALAAVFLSPTAWLSPTLRRWVLAGALTGTVLGMAILARRARIAELRQLLASGPAAGRLLARAKGLGRLAWWGLGTALVAAVLLRAHLAAIDVAFAQRYSFLLPLFDFYLGGGAFAAALYNVVAGTLSAVVVAGLVSGGPAALLRWRENQAAARSLAGEGGPLSGFEEALKSLDAAKLTLTAAKARLIALQVERDELAARLELVEPGASTTGGSAARSRPAGPPEVGTGPPVVGGASATSGPEQQDRRDPRAAVDRPPR